MNYLSVCSGIEAATVAWHDLKFNPVGFSEIEKFPSEVLAYHYPHVTNYGDMTKFKEWNINDTVGLLVGGTPCQSFSVAGLRKGLADPRGNLMLTYLAMADHFKPKWLLWENVPGVLSSNGGSDFAALLQGMAQLGYGFAYRVLDAQHFGVPQRRRRVFVVGCLGDWRNAAKVLFESESLCRDITPRRSKGKNASDWPKDCASTLNASFGNKLGLENQHINSGAPLFVQSVYENHGTDSRVKEVDVCPTMTSRWGTGGNNVPFALAENTIGRQSHNGGNGNGFTEGGPMYTLNASGVHGIAVDIYNGTMQGDIASTLTTKGGGAQSVPSLMKSMAVGFDSYNLNETGNVSQTIKSPQGGVLESIGGVRQGMAVRRLTPVECERLQGFPDNYTNIKENCPDGHRYKALGNSMAVPVMKWIGKRIIENDF